MRRDKSGCFFKRGVLMGSPIRDIHEGKRVCGDIEGGG